MAGKMGALAAEEYEFLEGVMRKCDHITSLVEQYAGANKGADVFLQQMTRTLSQVRQQAMGKNLGFVADHAGMLGIAAARGSQLQRARTIREGTIALKQLLERTMKALVDSDKREQANKAEALLATKAAEKAAGGEH